MTSSGHQASLLAFPSAERVAGEVGVMVFNAQHASPSRSREQAAWIAAHDHADLVVVSEVSGHHATLAHALGEHGYHVAQDDSAADYRVLVAGRCAPLSVLSELGVAVLAHRVQTVRVRIEATTVVLMGAYVPSRGSGQRRNVDKRAVQDALTALLPRLCASPADIVVAAGDLNVVEPDHTPHHSVFGAWEYDFYRAFAENGLHDAFRHAQPAGVDHSWYGRSGAGYRFDHTFTTTPERVVSSFYDHEPRQARLSDHAAMITRLTL
ncbi:endonuclease/exonuclease/phosphatase family protein [Salinactinospora qingdaonensis]|uniref:Endonuclease/exonuclease/phosphatase domain-containing protein n=1 Tax=Salinactinospora qingdaonensis TaxID=702744 RepID=A0ABP7GLG8_9ACTN